jgi:hypothetical protein
VSPYRIPPIGADSRASAAPSEPSDARFNGTPHLGEVSLAGSRRPGVRGRKGALGERQATAGSAASALAKSFSSYGWSTSFPAK